MPFARGSACVRAQRPAGSRASPAPFAGGRAGVSRWGNRGTAEGAGSHRRNPDNKKGPSNRSSTGQIWGLGVRHALFPRRLHLALSLSRAADSPTPLRTACADLGLMAGPPWPLPAGVYRVRPLCPVRRLPAGNTLAEQGADTPASDIRVGTGTTRTAPAFGRALAPCDGSDLLPLRLPLPLQSGDMDFHAALARDAGGSCRTRASQRAACCFRAPTLVGWGLLAGGARRERTTRAGTTVAAGTLWGHGISPGFETSPAPDSTRTRFLTSRLVAQLLIRVTTGTGTTPSRGAGDACLRHAIARAPRGRWNQLPTVLSPVARDYPSLRFRRVFHAAVRLAVLSRNEASLEIRAGKVTL